MSNLITLIKAFLAFVGAFFIRRSGANAVLVKQLKKSQEATNKARKIDNSVNSTDYDGVINELHTDWTR